jgi:hypothetical protein
MSHSSSRVKMLQRFATRCPLFGKSASFIAETFLTLQICLLKNDLEDHRNCCEAKNESRIEL